MIDLNSAQNALKDAYLSAVSNVLNTKTNPLFAKIKQSSNDVYGRQIIKVAPFGTSAKSSTIRNPRSVIACTTSGL